MGEITGQEGALSAPAQTKPKSWAMKAAFALLASGLLVAFIGLAPSCSRLAEGPYAQYATGAMANFQSGEASAPTPEQSFVDAAGRETRVADFEGRVAVVNLWATWCAPCVEEMPTLAGLQSAFPEAQVSVVALSVDRLEARGLAERKLAELSGGALDFYHDPNMQFVFAAQAKGFPTTIVYGKDGREIGRLAGAADWASPEAKALVRAALAE